MIDRCQVNYRKKRCRLPSGVVYYGRGTCWEHWAQHCDEERTRFNLKRIFGIEDEHAPIIKREESKTVEAVSFAKRAKPKATEAFAVSFAKRRKAKK